MGTILKNHIVRIALITGAILLIPLVAMQFSSEMKWDETDFIVVGILIFGTCLVYDLITRKARTRKQRVIVGLALLAVFLYLYVELAVGIFTNWGS